MLKKTIKNTFVGIIAVATTAFIMTPVYAGGHLPGEGKTVRPVEGTNLEEKFQHKILDLKSEFSIETSDPVPL